MGKKVEVIAKSKEGILMNPDPVFRIKVGKDSSVLSQQAMNIPDKVV